MHVSNRRRCDGEILNPHFGNFFHDHVDDIVPFTEMVVEGNSHAVFEAGLFNGFAKATQEFFLAWFNGLNLTA